MKISMGIYKKDSGDGRRETSMNVSYVEKGLEEYDSLGVFRKR